MRVILEIRARCWARRPMRRRARRSFRATRSGRLPCMSGRLISRGALIWSFRRDGRALQLRGAAGLPEGSCAGQPADVCVPADVAMAGRRWLRLRGVGGRCGLWMWAAGTGTCCGALSGGRRRTGRRGGVDGHGPECECGAGGARRRRRRGAGSSWVAGDAYTCSGGAGGGPCDQFAADASSDGGGDCASCWQWMERTARVGWFINDLHRQAVPYCCFGAMMRGPWWHRFIRPDGLGSIRRSFLREDWQRMCAAAGLVATISEHRPARLCVGSIRKEMAATLCGGHQG